jgi:hypothetical protein
MGNDLTELLGSREIFWELQEVAKENKKVLSPAAFFDWMCWNYISTVSVGIRRFMDQSKDSHSLWRMLYEMLEHPGILDRETHARMYASSPMGIEFGRQCYANVVGKMSPHLSQRTIRSDLRQLEDVSERVRRFVNKRIAHHTSPGTMRRLPRFNEIDAALNKLDEILSKYNFLLTAQGNESFHATRQYNWREVLLSPWIPQGSTLHPDSQQLMKQHKSRLDIAPHPMLRRQNQDQHGSNYLLRKKGGA